MRIQGLARALHLIVAWPRSARDESAQMATVLGIRREYEVAVEGLGFSLSLECEVRIVSFEVEAVFSQDSTQPSFRPCPTFASCCDPGTGASADRCGSESFASTFRKTGAHMGSWAPGSDAVGAEKLATSRAVPSHPLRPALYHTVQSGECRKAQRMYRVAFHSVASMKRPWGPPRPGFLLQSRPFCNMGQALASSVLDPRFLLMGNRLRLQRL